MERETAMKILKELHGKSLFAERTALETLIPELKESEDERIRKALVRFHKSTIDIDGIKGADILAWLEKQGEHANFRNKIQIGDKVTRNEDGVLVNLSQMNRAVEEYNIRRIGSKHAEGKLAEKIKELNDMLEKQGEQKTAVTDFNAKDWYVSKVDGKIHDMTYNPADKVEPKFHEGDWINGYYTNYKVTAISNKEYVVEDTDGNKMNILFENEKFHNLWTIQDAKDGDVLVDSYGNVCIYQEPSTNLMYHSRCYANNKGFYDLGGSHAISNTYPATKEQRDILFQKMKEAGYEWDADKKELKKVGQKLTELAKGEDYGIDGLYAAVDILQKTLGEVDGYQTDDGILEHECAISAVKKLYEQNPTWSEEDDYNLQCMIAKVTSDIQKGNVGRNNELIDWLKSLKERIGG